jgi:hypothetical protein
VTELIHKTNGVQPYEMGNTHDMLEFPGWDAAAGAARAFGQAKCQRFYFSFQCDGL